MSVLPLPRIHPVLPLPQFHLNEEPAVTFMRDLLRDTPARQRAPDFTWRDPQGAELKVWIVDLGRPQGARIDWSKDGIAKDELFKASPAAVRAFVTGWKNRDTDRGAA